MGILLGLTKFKISIFSTLSAITGFVLSKSGVSMEMIPISVGVFLLASGSSALNQFQEREYDQWMERTRNRPIPSKRLTPILALQISLLLLFSGGLILLYGTNKTALLLSAFAVSWYHFVYTPLKRITGFAIIPGAIIGAIPPMIGWISGGGQLHDPKILFISFFFYIWQVPHCWILQFNFRRDYEKVGFPTLTQIFTQSQFDRILLIWLLSIGASCFLIPMFGLLKSPLIFGGLFSIGGGLLWKVYRNIITRDQGWDGPTIFRAINIYIFLVMVCFLLGRLIFDKIHYFLF